MSLRQQKEKSSLSEESTKDEAMHAILDSALDDLDSDDDDDDDGDLAMMDENDASNSNNTESSKKERKDESKPPDIASSVEDRKRPAEKPSTTSIEDEEDELEKEMGALSDLMKGLLNGGGNDDLDGDQQMGAFVQGLQSLLVEELRRVEDDEEDDRHEENDTAATKSSKTTLPTASKSEKKKTEKRPMFGPEPPPYMMASSSSNHPDGNVTDVDRTISKLMQGMAESASVDNDDDDYDDQAPPNMDELMKVLNPDDVLDGMVGQLLSKELMYEPMKQVAERFPAWLERNKAILSSEEYQNRCKQYDCFQQLIQVYEKEDDEQHTHKQQQTDKLMDLMQQVQEYGQPPAEIVKEIVPGLELDENGAPKLDVVGDECTIM